MERRGSLESPQTSAKVAKIENDKVIIDGSLEDVWDFLPAKFIKDPEAKKPEEWDDRAKIDDPEGTFYNSKFR